MKKIFVLLAMTVIMAAGVGVANAKIPLPSDIVIVPPDPSLPGEIKLLSGTWEGSWSPGPRAILIFEKIEKQGEGKFRATVIYGQDDFVGQWTTLKAASRRFDDAEIISDENGVRIKFGDNFARQFTIVRHGSSVALESYMLSSMGKWNIMMKKK